MAASIRSPLHQPLAGHAEPDLLVEAVGIGRVQEPPHVRVGAVLDRLADELEPEPPPSVLGQDVHVGEIGDRGAVRHRPGEADLALAVVEADDAVGLADQPFDRLARASLRPVGTGEERVGGVEVDASRIVVELEPARESLSSSVLSLAACSAAPPRYCAPWEGSWPRLSRRTAGIAIAELCATEELGVAAATRAGMEELRRRFADAQPEAIVVLTPHNVHVEGAMAVIVAGQLEGVVGGEDGRSIALTCPVDLDAGGRLARRLLARGHPIGRGQLPGATAPPRRRCRWTGAR